MRLGHVDIICSLSGVSIAYWDRAQDFWARFSLKSKYGVGGMKSGGHRGWVGTLDVCSGLSPEIRERVGWSNQTRGSTRFGLELYPGVEEGMWKGGASTYQGGFQCKMRDVRLGLEVGYGSGRMKSYSRKGSGLLHRLCALTRTWPW